VLIAGDARGVHDVGTVGDRTRLNRQGQRDGDVDEDVDAQAQAMLLQTTLAGLRVMARTFDRPALYRIIDTSLAGL
jgi:hypothetical protein